MKIFGEYDLCIVGGSCTGVFAAVRAAQQGMKVCIVEKQNCFGGVGTSSLVNVWHNLKDAEFNKQIIGGLTEKLIGEMRKTNDIIERPESPSSAFVFNSEVLKILLDRLVLENEITPYLHTSFYEADFDKDKITSVTVGNKDGLGKIKARFFIDATGDGDLCRNAGVNYYLCDNLQPPTLCAKLYGIERDNYWEVSKLIKAHSEEFGLQKDWGWRQAVPGAPLLSMNAETHVFDVNCADASQLTYAEMEGRRQVDAVVKLLRKYHPNGKDIVIASLPSYIGIRETYHVETMYKLNSDELLSGKQFDDAIANGSYRVDYHHAKGAGITFKYLDGRQETIAQAGEAGVWSRWREETETNPTFYQIPFRSLIPKTDIGNLLCAGRMIDSDQAAFSAARVMVNCNQMGEAAGVAASLCLKNDCRAKDADADKIRGILADNGAIII